MLLILASASKRAITLELEWNHWLLFLVLRSGWFSCIYNSYQCHVHEYLRDRLSRTLNANSGPWHGHQRGPNNFNSLLPLPCTLFILCTMWQIHLYIFLYYFLKDINNSFTFIYGTMYGKGNINRKLAIILPFKL